MPVGYFAFVQRELTTSSCVLGFVVISVVGIYADEQKILGAALLTLLFSGECYCCLGVSG